MRTTGRITISVTLGVMLLSVLAGAGGARAAGDHAAGTGYAGRSEAQVLDASLFGRRAAFGESAAESGLDGDRLTARSTAVGTSVLPGQTKSVASLGDPAGGGRRCATPDVAGVLGAAATSVPGGLPGLDVGAACGEATATGDTAGFAAESTAGEAGLAVTLPATLGRAVQDVQAGLDPAVLPLSLAELVGRGAPPAAGQAVEALSRLLGSLVPGLGLPAIGPTQTVGTFLERLGHGPLARVALGTASARNRGDSATYLVNAVAGGGFIDVLPELVGPGSAPLLRITVADSDAEVKIDRVAGRARARVTDPVVRLASPLLDQLGVAGLPVADGVLGGGLPLGRMIQSSGPRSGPGYIELSPGQSLSVLCRGPAPPLCSEISVSPAGEPVTSPEGRTTVGAATVTVRLFERLDSLRAGLGTILGDAGVGQVLGPLAAAAGLELAEPSADPGLRLTLARARAEAGVGAASGAAPASVLGMSEGRSAPVPSPAEASRAGLPGAPAGGAGPKALGTLPRTGGLPVPAATVPMLLLASAGVRTGLRRRAH